MASGPINPAHNRIQYCETRFDELLRDLRNADANIVLLDLAIALSVIHYRFARRGPFPNHLCYAYQAGTASIGRVKHCIERLQLLADEIHTRHRMLPTAISIGARYVLRAIEDDLPGGKLTSELIQEGHPWLAGLNVHDDFILIRGPVIIA
jgi:hypothetical protein